jgi:hypothetical protein
MDIATIEIPVEEAKARLAEYEESLKTDRNAEDEAIAMGYRAAARGLPVIQLSKCMDRGGWFDNGMPRLAVARADATECHVTVQSGGHNPDRWGLTFADRRNDNSRGALVGAHVVRTHQAPPTMWTNRAWRGSCIVPIVPPRFRPRRPRLSRCHVLWEVEKWDPTPPVDPALIRHIRGDLWAVLATWDLTELERAVLSGR